MKGFYKKFKKCCYATWHGSLLTFWVKKLEDKKFSKRSYQKETILNVCVIKTTNKKNFILNVHIMMLASIVYK